MLNPLRWRKATWALAIFNVLMLIWAISIGQTAQNNCSGTSKDLLAACQAGTGIGAGIGFTIVLVLWFIGFIVLSLVWLMSRPNKRLCPQCGTDVKKGLTGCNKCGYSFVQAQPSPALG